MLRVLMKPKNWTPTKLNNMVHEYGYFLNDQKRREFGKLGEFDCNERIGSFEESCDYSIIMKSLCPSVVEFEDFGRTLDIASDIHDVNDAMSYASILQSEFLNMPKEVKEKYANDYEVFARAVVDGSFASFVTEKYGSDKGVESPGVDIQPSDEQRGRDERGVGGDEDVGVLVGQLRAEVDSLRKVFKGEEVSE